jgi:putative ABC transport system permease protein
MTAGLIRDLRLALRNLTRNTNRTLVAVGTVASGVIAFLLAGGFIEWSLMYGREETIHSQLGHAQIVRPDYFEKGIADPYAFLLPADSPEQKKIETQPGVLSLAPRLAFNGLISHGETTVVFVGEGIDPLREKHIGTRVTFREGQDLQNAMDRQAVLGEGLAKALGVKPGDTVVLLATAANGGANALEATVSGIFSTITKEYDDHAIRLPISLARKLMRVEGATSWVVALDATERTDSFVNTAIAALAGKSFQIVPWRELADFYNKTEALFTKQVTVMKVIIGLIIVLTIMNTLTMSVLERTTEIGTSLAVGLAGRLVMRLFIIEGTLIGVVGGAAGIVMGYLLAMGISAIGIPMPPPPGMAHGYTAEILVTPSLVFDAAILALVTTLLASAFPAWKAGRMNIVDALRYSQ